MPKISEIPAATTPAAAGDSLLGRIGGYDRRLMFGDLARDLTYSPAGTGAAVRHISTVFGETPRITDYGGVGDDATDNTTAAANARAAAGANRPIVLNNGDYNVNQTTAYSSDYQDALGTMWSAGTAASPVTRHEPILWVEKVLSGTRAPSTGERSQGMFISLQKAGGDVPSVALTTRNVVTDGTGSAIGLHTRVRFEHSGAGVGGHALWAYADISSLATGDVSAHAGELSVANNSGNDYGWRAANTSPLFSGLILGTEGTSPGTVQFGISLQKVSGGGYYTGMMFQRDAILPDTTDAINLKAEAIRIRGGGGTTGVDARYYTGIWFHDGHLRTGINLAGPTYDKAAAMVIALDDKIVFGADNSGTRQLYCDNSGRLHFTAPDAAAGYYNNDIPWLTGVGTPEGVVTAPVGALFSRTDGGASTTIYIKESGVGNTGWVAK